MTNKALNALSMAQAGLIAIENDLRPLVDSRISSVCKHIAEAVDELQQTTELPDQLLDVKAICDERDRLRVFKQAVLDPENQPSQFGTQLMDGIPDTEATGICTFLLSAIEHIENGGNLAQCEMKLASGITVTMAMDRVVRPKEPATGDARTPDQNSGRDPNSGHGHVYERPDGVKARCGGPALCPECAREMAALRASYKPQALPSSERCVWTRLPNVTEALRLDLFRYKPGCATQIARSIHPIHPDNCPKCGKPVVFP